MTRPCKVDRPIETLISKHNLLSAFNGYCKINVIVPQMSSCTPHNLRDENKKSKPIYRPPKVCISTVKYRLYPKLSYNGYSNNYII